MYDLIYEEREAQASRADPKTPKKKATYIAEKKTLTLVQIQENTNCFNN